MHFIELKIIYYAIIINIEGRENPLKKAQKEDFYPLPSKKKLFRKILKFFGTKFELIYKDI